MPVLLSRLKTGLDRIDFHYRAGVFLRAVAAIAGGYAVTSLLVISLALWLPQSQSDAVLTGTLLSFLIYALLVMMVFSVRSAWRAWLWTAALAAVAGLPWLITHLTH